MADVYGGVASWPSDMEEVFWLWDLAEEPAMPTAAATPWDQAQLGAPATIATPYASADMGPAWAGVEPAASDPATSQGIQWVPAPTALPANLPPALRPTCAESPAGRQQQQSQQQQQQPRAAARPAHPLRLQSMLVKSEPDTNNLADAVEAKPRPRRHDSRTRRHRSLALALALALYRYLPLSLSCILSLARPRIGVIFSCRSSAFSLVPIFFFYIVFSSLLPQFLFILNNCTFFNKVTPRTRDANRAAARRHRELVKQRAAATVQHLEELDADRDILLHQVAEAEVEVRRLRAAVVSFVLAARRQVHVHVMTKHVMVAWGCWATKKKKKKERKEETAGRIKKQKGRRTRSTESN